jgi:hypothetical protein
MGRGMKSDLKTFRKSNIHVTSVTNRKSARAASNYVMFLLYSTRPGDSTMRRSRCSSRYVSCFFFKKKAFSGRGYLYSRYTPFSNVRNRSRRVLHVPVWSRAQVNFLVDSSPRNFMVSVFDRYFSRYGLIHF